ATAGLRLRASFRAGDRGGAGVRGVVVAGVLAALALAVYGVVRYPDLRAGPRAWSSGVLLVVLLLGYAAAGLTLSRGSEPLMAAARRYGLAGGLVVGAAWLVVLAPGERLKGVVVVPLAVALLAPVAAAVRAGRASRDPRTGTH